MRTRLVLSIALLLAAGCAARTKTSTTGATGEQRFASPRAAVDALLSACRADDEARLRAIFGPQAQAIVSTGDPALDHERCQRLLTAANASTRLDPKGADTVQLVVGSDDWAMPIPIVKDGGAWRFDTAAGIQETRHRRIGADELEAITACRVYVRAQEAYAARTRPKTYAQKLASTLGKRDGLYWPSTRPSDASPLGAAAAAVVDPATGKPRAVWRGYHYRILTAQGADATGGARSYVADGRMTGGFALVAYPVAYGSTGIMMFVVGTDGRVYEKDLGEKTAEVAAAMTEYNPDRTWKPVSG
jgi:hypothetical protein